MILPVGAHLPFLSLSPCSMMGLLRNKGFFPRISEQQQITRKQYIYFTVYTPPLTNLDNITKAFFSFYVLSVSTTAMIRLTE